MADVMAAFLAGHQAGQAEKDHAQQLEENKLRMLVLKHQIEGLKIQDQIRARDLANQNFEYTNGAPAADIPSDDVTTPGTPPAPGLAGVVSGLLQARNVDGSPAPTASTPPTPALPQDAQTVLGTPPQTTRVPRSIDIPGVPGLGVSGVSRRPRTMEDHVRARTQEKLADPYTLNEGDTRFLGTTPIAKGGARLQAVGAGGLYDPETKKKVVDGRAASPQHPQVVNGRVLDPSDPTKVVANYPPQETPDGKTDREQRAKDLETQRTWERDFRQFTSDRASAEKHYVEQMKAFNEEASNRAVPGYQGLAEPQLPSLSFDDWRAQRDAKTPKPATPAASTQAAPGAKADKSGTSADDLTVTDPKTGRTFKAPDKKTADAARKAFGVKP
jgi:hypothetical protein